MYPQPVICLEGPDCAGKTTLARHLQEKYGYQYHHEGVPEGPDEPLVHYGRVLLEAVNNPDGPVVMDRAFVGEAVYGPLMRNTNHMTKFGLVTMNRVLAAYGVKLVFCLPGYETSVKHWRARKTEYVKDEGIFKQVYDRFEKLAGDHNTFPLSVTYNFNQIDTELAGQLLTRTDVGSYPMGHWLPKGMIGSPSATFLFVGEVANQDDLDLPFFSTSGCSPWFYQVLVDAGYTEQEMAFANALTLLREPNYNIQACAKKERFVRIVALGKVASHTLRRTEVRDFVEVAHPQYWKRFHEPARTDYVAELAKIRKGAYAASSR